MSLFDVIKYSVGDVYLPHKMTSLPKDVVAKWVRRVEEYSLDIGAQYAQDPEVAKHIRSIFNARAGIAANVSIVYCIDLLHYLEYGYDYSLWSESRDSKKDKFKQWLIDDLEKYEETVCM